MMELDVRIEKLEPMRVASFHGFGTEPEAIAFGKLAAYAQPRGYLNDLETNPVFGFNNPNPSAGSPNYGYEVWLSIGPEVEPKEGDDFEIKEFEGGTYGVTRCEVKGDFEVIGETWKKLNAWREDSNYGPGNWQWFERSIKLGIDPPDEFILDLYIPISE